ncbi:MAG: terminase [Gammaproteobacteria bacterium]|nr:terminase [Gammaproteobacteria bacterium]
MDSSLYSVKDGKATLHLHAGQLKAWDSKRRFVAVLSGTQGGKTSYGPLWLWREIQQCGAGDYMVVTPTYPLLELKALPEFKRWFVDVMGLGEYKTQSKQFVISKAGEVKLWGKEQDIETRVLFGYAAEPESLESATAKAAWLDEAGQKRFKVDSWEAIRRRLSIHQGRILITTTPYNLGWLKQRIWDKWKAGDKEIDVIRFESIANPLFSRAEWDSARRSLPAWKFDMFYRAIFTRPAGLIYDAFDDKRHKCPRFPLDANWPRYIGVDFGGVNTAALFYAKDPGSGRLYLYREYKAGGRTAAQHKAAMLEGEPFPMAAYGGAGSEDQWRKEFVTAGLPIQRPNVAEVEVGINRVYGAHREDKIIVFDDLDGYLDEKMTYSRKLDGNGEPTEEIEDKNTFHFMDAERYIIGSIIGGTIYNKPGAVKYA